MNNSKRTFYLILYFAFVVIAAASCYKPKPYPLPNPNPNRTIHYELFTESDALTEDNHTILFSLFIEHFNGRAIWDSSLAPMKVNEIPTLANKIVAHKMVTDTGLLRVGFKYTIVDIGFSGLVDTINANNNFKMVSLSFR